MQSIHKAIGATRRTLMACRLTPSERMSAMLDDLRHDYGWPRQRVLEEMERKHHFWLELAALPPEQAHFYHVMLCALLPQAGDVLNAWRQSQGRAWALLARVAAVQMRRRGETSLVEQLRAVHSDDEAVRCAELARAMAAPDWEAVRRRPTMLEPEGALDADEEAWASQWHASASSSTSLRQTLIASVAFSPRATLAIAQHQLTHAASPAYELHETLRLLSQTHGEHFQRAAVHLVGRRHQGWLTFLYPLLEPSDAHLPVEAHLEVLAEGGRTVQGRAIRALRDRVPVPLESIAALLESRKANARAGAARALAVIGDAQATAALRRALKKERSKKVAPLLKEALETCDVAQARIKTEANEAAWGTYTRAQPPALREDIETLRELFYEDATALTWARLCDLIQRSHRRGQLSTVMEYLRGHGVERWESSTRLVPSEWTREPELASLIPDSPHDMQKDAHWITVDDLFEGQGVNRALDRLEARVRTRKLDRALLPGFAAWVERSWAWCRQEGFSPSNIDARLRSSPSEAGESVSSTCLELHQGFFISLARRKVFLPADRHDGVAWVRVTIPAGHALRDKLGMIPQQPTLNLITHLS